MKRSTASKIKDINRLFAELASKQGARILRFNARPTVPRRAFRKYIAAQWHALFCGFAARFMLALPGERGDLLPRPLDELRAEQHEAGLSPESRARLQAGIESAQRGEISDFDMALLKEDGNG